MTTKSKFLKRIFRLYLMVVGTVFWIMPRNSIWLFDSSLAQVLSQYRYLKTLSTFRQVQKRRRLSKRRKSTTSEWMSSKSFFACGKDVSLVSLFLFQIFHWNIKNPNLNHWFSETWVSTRGADINLQECSWYFETARWSIWTGLKLFFTRTTIE